jgi:membrane protease YdiL (CAAX protease family)
MDTKTLSHLLYLALGAGVLVLWTLESRASRTRGADAPEPFWPGARPCAWQAAMLAGVGALLLTLVESGLEIHLGVDDEQSSIPASFLLAMMGAAVVEEVTFRGFAAPASLAGVRLLASILAGSLVFMLLHGHIVSFDDGALRVHDDPKSLVSAGSAFAVSCWLYLCRFNPLNPGRSLAPALVGHAVRNLAVFGIKDAQGFVAWN